jgi:hypothetical protein
MWPPTERDFGAGGLTLWRICWFDAARNICRRMTSWHLQGQLSDCPLACPASIFSGQGWWALNPESSRSTTPSQLWNRALWTVEDVGRGRIFYPEMWPRYAKIGDQLKRRSSSDATKVGVEHGPWLKPPNAQKCRDSWGSQIHWPRNNGFS